MKNIAGAILIALGIVFTLASSVNAQNAPNVSALIGTFLPGLLFLIIGLALRQEKTPEAPAKTSAEGLESTDMGKAMRSNRFKTRANLGVGVGIVAMFMGNGLAQQGPDLLLAGGAVSLCGWGLLIWGCVNYARWKGYPGWFGLFGYLLLPGLIVLFCFPNKRKRMFQKPGTVPIAEMDALSTRDRSSGYRFLLTLVPLALLFVTLGGFLFFARANINSAEWQQVAPAGSGFQALMPGTPALEQKTQETPAGNLEMTKVTVHPKGKKELFMIVAIHFPKNMDEQLGGTEQLLELGKKDLLTATQGQLQNESQIVSGNLPGRELEILPPRGAIIKARLFATKDRIYQLSVLVPKIRLSSEDVQKFFDSFRLLAEPQTGR